MIINMKVPDEAVKELGILMRDNLHCNCIGDCETCKEIIGCECLSALREACYGGVDVCNSVCEVNFSEE